MVKRLGYASALILAGILAAAPAGANEDFPGRGSMHIAGTRTLSAVEATPAGDESVSTLPKPAGWLMMLVGFGLLGAMNRRSDPHPLRDELGL